MYTLDFSLIFNSIIDNIDSLSEEELLEQLNLLYRYINLPDEIKASNKLKEIIYKTIKDIITLYKYKSIVVNKSRNNYLCGNNPTNLINSEFSSPYNFLKLDLDDFEINNFTISGEIGKIEQAINISNLNFFPITSKIISDNYKISTRQREISFVRTGLTTNELKYTDTYTFYINNIIDSIRANAYVLRNIQIDDYKKLGLNALLDIVYYQIEQRDIKPINSLIIKRCHKYPEYIEVTKNNQKFLTTFNIANGINSLINYDEPSNKAITRIDGNVYTSYMLSGQKIESKEEKIVDEIQDDQEKNDFVKYYSYVNKTL